MVATQMTRKMVTLSCFLLITSNKVVIEMGNAMASLRFYIKMEILKKEFIMSTEEMVDLQRSSSIQVEARISVL